MRGLDADVLIAGGGLAAQRCCETLRREGHEGTITILCAEQSRPYDRPVLSKSVLLGTGPGRELEFRPEAWYGEQGVRLELGTSAVGLDPATRTVTVMRAGRPGGRLRYGRLVIATGARPRSLAGLAPGGRLHELRTREDAGSLREALAARGGRLAVIGAGLIGMEVASAARARGLEVTLLEAGATPLERALPASLGRWIAELHRSQGVEVRLGRTVARAVPGPAAVRLSLDDGSRIEAQTVLVAAGSSPATEWLAGSGLGAGMIQVDAAGRTALPGVFAAGDAASFPDPFLDANLPSQHWEAAVRQGTAVARAILGRPQQLPMPAMFWSDQHGRRIQMVGHAPAPCSIEFEGSPLRGEPFAARISGPRGPAAVLLVDRPDLLPGARRWVADALITPEPQGVPRCPT